MRQTTVVLGLLIATQAFAAGVDAPRRSELEVVDSPRRAQVLRSALGAFALSDGSLWVTHFAPARREPGSIGVTRFGADGSEREFLVSDWLPKGSTPGGAAGQVYAVTLLTDGRVAVSAGWTDGADAHNGIFILRAGKDGRYTTDKLIEWPGVADIVAGPRNTILAATFDASRRGGGPLLTLFDAEGRMRAKALDHQRPISPAEAAQTAMKVRLHRFNERTFVVYDPADDTLGVLDIEVLEDKSIWSARNVIFIGDDASLADTRVLGISMTQDGDVLVARVGNIGGKLGTHLAVYGQDSSIRHSTVLDRPWKFMLQENGRVRGVVPLRDGVGLDPLPSRRDK